MGQDGNFSRKGCTEDKAEEKLRHAMGRRITSARMALDLSQCQLAARLGITRSRLSKWELGRHAPNLRQLLAIADALGLSLDELLRERHRAA